MTYQPAEDKERRRVASLTRRVVMVLTIAVLPLGLISVIQAGEHQKEALRRSELAVLALTERATAAQAKLIQAAIGAADTLAQVFPRIAADPDVCTELMMGIGEANPQFSFAGYIGADGVVHCANSGSGTDVSHEHSWQSFMADPQSTVTSVANGTVAQEWVIIVREPIYRNGAFAAAATIAIPHRLLSRSGDEMLLSSERVRPMQLLTFNADGEVLSRLAGSSADYEDDLPRGELSALAEGGARAFTAGSRSNGPRTYAITPVVTDQVYVVGVWEPEFRRASSVLSWLGIILFPLLMWVVSLVVASLAMQWLVLTHVEKLRRKMRVFGRSRELAETPSVARAPSEFREMDAEFMAMADAVMRDEAQLEDAVREKNILLKEIHHRVKNNLQLLSSIISMKRRRANEAETRVMLQQLQDRILSLAAIHRNLYLAKDMSAVDAGQLVTDVAAQLGFVPGQAGFELDLDPVRLVPEQAVPFSLFVAEGLALADPSNGDPLRITLGSTEDGLVTLALDLAERRGGLMDDGMASGLFAAYADQLAGESAVHSREGNRRHLELRFRPMAGLDPAQDY